MGHIPLKLLHYHEDGAISHLRLQKVGDELLVLSHVHLELRTTHLLNGEVALLALQLMIQSLHLLELVPYRWLLFS